MGFLLQITMGCPCVLSRQVAGAGCRCCELAVHVVGTGCWCRCWCWVPGAGAGANWLCTRHAVETGCWCWCRVLAVRAVETGCRCWCLVLPAGCARGGDRVRCWAPGAGSCCELAVHVVETGCRCWRWVLAVRVVETGCRVPVPGCRSGRWLCGWGGGFFVPQIATSTGFLLLQLTMKWLCCGAGAGCCGNRVPVLGAGARCWCGLWRWCWVL